MCRPPLQRTGHVRRDGAEVQVAFVQLGEERLYRRPAGVGRADLAGFGGGQPVGHGEHDRAGRLVHRRAGEVLPRPAVVTVLVPAQ